MNNPFFITLLISFLVMVVYYSLFFVVAIIKKRNDVADIAWGTGFFVVSICPLLIYDLYSMRSFIITTLVLIWGARLSWHIYTRNKGKPEDYRYQAVRQRWGSYFYLATYLEVFLLQGCLLLIVVTPVLFINTYQQQGITIFDCVGMLIWLLGFGCESVADYQLATFLKNPQNHGLLLTSGLWRYSRHPNYFGEIVQWWGIFIAALSLDGGWITIIGPATITFLIIKVSGIPLLEERMKNNPAFQAYKDKTSTLIPWPVHK